MITTRLTRGLAALLGGALLVALAGHASAHDRMGRLQEKLNLTPDQATAVREAFARDGAAERQIWQSLREAQGELRRLALDGAEPTALAQKAAEIQRLMAQELQLRVQRLQAIGAILTPEQRAAFAQLPPRHPRMLKGSPPPRS
jgi:Spy/CpxP family protein refolding chaperone